MATTEDVLREEVRRRYAESARAVTEGTDGASLGCGNPIAVAELHEGRRCSTSAPAVAST